MANPPGSPGAALIPLNVWAAWKNPDTALGWTTPALARSRSTLNRLSLGDTLLLAGRQLPFQGELTGPLDLDGTPAKLSAHGALAIREAAATFPAGLAQGRRRQPGISRLPNARKIRRRNLEFPPLVRQRLRHRRAMSAHPSSISPSRSPPLPSLFAPGATAQVSFDLHAGGPPAALSLSGGAHLLSLDLPCAASAQDIVANHQTGLSPPFPPLALPGPPAWKLDLSLTGDGAPVILTNAKGLLSPALHIGGTIARPRVAGSFRVQDFALPHFTLQEGSVFLDSGDSDPTFVAEAAGLARSRSLLRLPLRRPPG